MSSIQDIYLTIDSTGKVFQPAGLALEESVVQQAERGFEQSRSKGKAGELVVLYGIGKEQKQTVVLVGTGEKATKPPTTEAAQNKLKVSRNLNDFSIDVTQR